MLDAGCLMRRKVQIPNSNAQGRIKSQGSRSKAPQQFHAKLEGVGRHQRLRIEA
jgi:hypothetical protein